jgi:hypothetical protein
MAMSLEEREMRRAAYPAARIRESTEVRQTLEEIREYNEERFKVAKKKFQALVGTWKDYPTRDRLGRLQACRPPNYHPDMCEIVAELMSDPTLCLSVSSLGANLGINESTLRSWEERYPDFSRSLAQGKAKQEQSYAAILSIGAHKYSQGLIFVMKNRHGWTDRNETNVNLRSFDEAIADTEAKKINVGWVDAEITEPPALEQAPE